MTDPPAGKNSAAAGLAAASAHSGRRRILAAGAGLGASVLLLSKGWAQPVIGTPDGLAAAINTFTAGKSALPGKVTLDISPIVDNGNSVPVTVTVTSPMTPAEHVTAIAIFNERNPQRDVVNFKLGPRAGRASVATRIRLATSQKLVAVAQLSDGTYWSHSVDVVVALAACIE
jgi:sulfur-oxidizing protein SoxY